MPIELKGRLANVTGGASGIGGATVLAFAQAGAAMVVWDIAEDAGLALVAEVKAASGQAAFLKFKVASPSEVEAAVQQFGRVDILGNHAGILRDGQLIKVKEGPN